MNSLNDKQLVNYFLNFFSNYSILEKKTRVYYYKDQVSFMEKNKFTTFYINFQHMMTFFSENDIPTWIHLEYLKYEDMINQAIKSFIEEICPKFSNNKIFNASIYNLPEILGIRELKTNKLGKLISVQGIITKASEVKPELIEACFSCLQCNTINDKIKQQFSYLEPKKCINYSCTNRTKWELLPKKSKIFDWQKITIQETNHLGLTGNMPRNFDIILRNEQTEKCQPGDLCIFTGTLVVIPDKYMNGSIGENYTMNINKNNFQRTNTVEKKLKNIGMKDINYKLIFICNNVKKFNSKWDINSEDKEIFYENLTFQEKSEIYEISKDPNLYYNLANSICPTIFGDIEVKKSLLLLLLSGVSKKTKENIQLRGDINICIIGDPSTGKSQFLKFINNFLPRSVYTSGKSSSSSGLTASVQKDPETGEFIIEAGALILADNGICCIDEFDKMNEKDQVSIHEAMEQQTISISKAGIQATLNARTSILAALNPVLGRYDRSKSLRYNLNLSDPILSRFDLIFILVDDLDKNKDIQVANHIIKSHSLKMKLVEKKYSWTQIKKYIQFAKNIVPKISIEAAEEIKKQYLKLRINNNSVRESYKITVRKIESIIRLSEAVARLHLSSTVNKVHVLEATKLIRGNLIKVYKPDYEVEISHTIKPTNNNINYAKNDDNPKIKEKVKIKNEEYEKFRKYILDYILIQNNSSAQLSDIINFFFLDNKDLINKKQDLEFNEKKIKAVINRMIKTEKVLINIYQGSNDNDITLKIHPNINL